MCFIIHENWTPENFNDFTVWIIEICVHHALFFLYTKQPSITSIDWSDKMQGKTWSCDPALSWPILLTSPTPNFSDLFCWPSRPKSHWSILLTSPTPNLTDLFCWPPWPPISLTYFTGLCRLPAQSLGLHGPTQGLQLLDLTQQLRLLPVIMGFLQTYKRKKIISASQKFIIQVSVFEGI